MIPPACGKKLNKGLADSEEKLKVQRCAKASGGSSKNRHPIRMSCFHPEGVKVSANSSLFSAVEVSQSSAHRFVFVRETMPYGKQLRRRCSVSKVRDRRECEKSHVALWQQQRFLAGRDFHKLKELKSWSQRRQSLQLRKQDFTSAQWSVSCVGRHLVHPWPTFWNQSEYVLLWPPEKV